MTPPGRTPNPPRTVWERWVAHRDRHPDREAVVHWVAGEAPFRWTWEALLATAAAFATRLGDCGVRPGDVCALIVRHHRLFYPLYLAVSGLGAIPAVLAYPNPRLHPNKFRQGLEGMAARSGLDWILTERELDGLIRPLVAKGGSTIRDLLFPLEWPADAPPPSGDPFRKAADPAAPCLLQHSSGTTGLQKAVVLSNRAVLDHLDRYGAAIGAGPDDRVANWLPLYHDMGLIAAFYLPLTLGLPLVQLDPFEWVVAPVILLEALSREAGTLAWLPNFAYNLMADRIREEDLAGIRLDRLRLLVNCSEPVRADSHDRFFRRFAPHGLRREALAACYAMAETTFAVSQTPPGAEASRVVLSRQAIAQGRAVPPTGGEPVRECVSSGRPIAGCEVRVHGEGGAILPEGAIGDIAIRSVSLFDGYRNNPEKTAEVLRDGWYFSGDTGFVRDGEVFVIGRKKDLLIVAGNNLYPEDLEDAAGKAEGVLPGRVIAFGLEDAATGTEQVCIVAESPAAADAAAGKAVRRAVVLACMAIDVTVTRVYLAPPRWLIKSSAGKPSRSANRERAVQELAWR